MLKDQLRKARKAAGKTQHECADHLGINFTTYSSYETGRREPDVLKIKKIAAFLGVTGDYLLETGFDKKNRKETIVCKDNDEVHLIRCYRTLNDAGKSAAISAVEGLAGNPALREDKSSTETA